MASEEVSDREGNDEGGQSVWEGERTNGKR